MKLAVTFFLTLVLASGASFGQYTGKVTVDSGEAGPLEKISIKVWLRDNNIDVSAISIPLKFSSPSLTLDSVSLVGTVFSGSDFGGFIAIDNNERTVRITVLPDDSQYPLPAVSFVDGVVAELFFQVAGNATSHTATIDSVYTDEVLYGDVHVYTRIDVADNTGTGVYLPDFVPGDIDIRLPTGVDDGPGGLLPGDFSLAQNYPNPFNPTTQITYALPKAGPVSLQVFNILGQEVKSLVEGYQPAGTYFVEFDGQGLPSGIYFYRLQHDGQSATRKMTLVK
jgi:hypothetical protein